jgi:DNA-binding MarR family transcriptional regulator
MTHTPIETLASLVEALRTIQAGRSGHPWLLLDLTMVQVKALILLSQHGPMRSRDLADGLGIAPSANTPLVDRLVRRGLARRQPDRTDRRIVWIDATARGRSIHARLMQMKSSVMAEVIEEIPARQRAGVAQSLSLLLAAAARVLARQKPVVRPAEAESLDQWRSRKATRAR